ncbi:MAG: hypothetical protein V4519_02260 [Patescibacteria group bacterium]
MPKVGKKAQILASWTTLILLIAILLPLTPAQAFEVSNQNVEDKNDFVLEPGKVELFLNPGEEATKAVIVTSRIRETTTFKIEIEDFIGSRDANQPVILLGNDKSPYSIKDSIVPEISEFTLEFGQRIAIPVKITVPEATQPGGFYASVLVSSQARETPATAAQGRTRVVSRVGSLMFIRVNGDANESGAVEDFRIAGEKKSVYEKGPFTFQVLFNNTGNVHLVPYGTVTIKNTLGKSISTLPLDAYFSLPNSLRHREVQWSSGFLFGRYKAELDLNRGYGGTMDHKEITFWVLPWKIVVAVLFGFLLISSILVYILRNFEFKKKGAK